MDIALLSARSSKDPNTQVGATFVYATDPEGNIVELQNWSTR